MRERYLDYKKKVFAYAVIILFTLTVIPNIFAQVDDSNTKYFRIQFFLIYDSTNEPRADLIVTTSDDERANYSIKEMDTPRKTTITRDGNTQYKVNGFITFTNPADAISYYNRIIANVNERDLVFGQIYILENNHHVSNPDPDVIINHIRYGDSDAILGSP